MGVGRSVIGFPLEHPFDLIKVRHQAQMNIHGTQLNEIAIARSIWRAEGVPGFYAGFLANMMRDALKSSYRYPMMLFFPNFYSRFTQDRYHKKLLSGLTIAALESLIISPL